MKNLLKISCYRLRISRWANDGDWNTRYKRAIVSGQIIRSGCPFLSIVIQFTILCYSLFYIFSLSEFVSLLKWNIGDWCVFKSFFQSYLYIFQNSCFWSVHSFFSIEYKTFKRIVMFSIWFCFYIKKTLQNT